MTTLENNENFYLHFPVVPRVERVAAIEEGNYPLPLESPIGARISVSHRSFSYLLSRRKETDLCTGQSIVRAWPRENEMERDFACISRTIRNTEKENTESIKGHDKDLFNLYLFVEIVFPTSFRWSRVSKRLCTIFFRTPAPSFARTRVLPLVFSNCY